jgi:hypothetical protein
MASDLSKYIGNALLLWTTGTAFPSAPVDTYCALFNGDPKASGTEVTTTISAGGREAITWDAVATDGADNVMTTSADVDFGLAAAGATITHVAVMDASTSGNVLMSKALNSPLVIETGDPVKVNAGDLSVTIGQ